MYTIIWL